MRRIFLFMVFFLYFCSLNYAKSTNKRNMRKIFTLLLLVAVATTMLAQTTPPSFTTAAGAYYNPFSIELTGNNIYYTLDGTTPTIESTKYTNAISVSEFGTTTTVKAASYANNTWSEVVSATYELKVAAPDFSVKGGVYEKLTNEEALTLSTETSGATVYYNDRGKDPKTEGSKLYGSLSILATRTINAVAFVTNSKGEKVYSDVTSEYYVISPIALFTSTNDVADGKYLINSNNKIAYSFYDHTNSGNFNMKDVTVLNKYIETNEFCAFSFTSTSGGYNIQDAYGRYLYMNNNTLCASSSKPSTGAVWSISSNKTSGATIKNTSTGKIIAYNSQEAAFGLYAENETSGKKLPVLYKNIEYPTITITPEDGDTLSEFSKFTVTCDAFLDYQETYKLFAYYKVGFDNTKNGFDYVDFIDDNTIEFSLEEPIKSSNDYSIVFPANIFTIDPDGLNKKNKEIIVRYTVESKEILEVTYANPANNETADSLQYLYFEFNQDINTNITNAAIKDKKGNEYPLTISAIDAWGSACSGNALCLKTEEPIKSSGEYTFVLKKEYVSAKENSKLTIAKDQTYKITVVEGLKISSITPNSSDIYESVNSITISLNKAIFHTNLSEIIVTDSNNKSYTFTKTTTEEETTSLTFTTATPLTDAGTYSFTIEGNVIYCENPNSDINEIESIPETVSTFIVKYPTSIENIDAEKEDTAIYDLSGRRINKISNAGIYIINNKKQLVK